MVVVEVYKRSGVTKEKLEKDEEELCALSTN